MTNRIAPIAIAALLMIGPAIAQDQPKYPTASDTRGGDAVKSGEPAMPQPQGMAPITPQPADPSQAAGKEQMRDGPAQQTSPNHAGPEQAPAK